jgi:hypothetical protein
MELHCFVFCFVPYVFVSFIYVCVRVDFGISHYSVESPHKLKKGIKSN